METDSINIYLPPAEVERFRIWARLEGVKVSSPDEMNMVNSWNITEIMFLGTKMMADNPVLFTVIKKILDTGRRIIGVGKSETDLEIKTESEIKTAISLSLDLYCVKADYKREETVTTRSNPKKPATKGKRTKS